MTLTAILSICFFACSIVCWINVRQIIKDKALSGVSVFPTFIYSATNFVEVLYFAEKLETWSAIGAASMLVANIVWLMTVFHYLKRAVRRADLAHRWG